MRFGSSCPRLAPPPNTLGPSPLGPGPAIAPSSLYLQPLDSFSFILAFERFLLSQTCFLGTASFYLLRFLFLFLSKSLKKVSTFIFFCSSFIYSFVKHLLFAMHWARWWGHKDAYSQSQDREGNRSSQYREVCALVEKSPMSPVGGPGISSPFGEWQRCWGELSRRRKP